MFPTLVWKIDVRAQLRDAIDAKAAKALAALTRMRRDLPPLAPGKGWQSVQTLQQREDFQDLGCVHRTVAGILQFVRMGWDEFEITACWATVLARGPRTKCTTTPTIS